MRRTAVREQPACRTWLVVGCLQWLLCSACSGQDKPPGTTPQTPGAEGAAYRLESLNDFYFGNDQELTGAWSLQKHTAVSDSWGKLENVPHFVRRWGASIPTLSGAQRVYRASAAFGQITQTPTDRKRRDLIEEDVPYAGALLVSLSGYGFNDDDFAGFEFVTGVVGPASGVEQAQQTGHRLLGINEPKGWDNQLRNEPLVNFNYMRKHKIVRRGKPADRSFDAAVSGRVCLGNLITQAGAAIEMRYGANMTAGFAYIPDPIGYAMNYKAELAPPNPSASSLYGSLVLRGTAVAHDMLLDGNTFKHSHSVDKKSFVGQAIAGLHYERRNWSAHFSVILPTDTVDTSRATAVEDRGKLAAVTLEWHR